MAKVELVMPRAEKSLRDYVLQVGRPFQEAEAVPILIDIARALAGLTVPDVVHRDLKPENVLLWNGAWCLADFGISRYAQGRTATDTFKYATTRPYVAPEQWREERVTAKTDVYAFGVIAHELLLGALPFAGPEFREQHLHQDPPVITGIAPLLAALIEHCLFKAPGPRPAPSRLLSDLESRSAAAPARGGLAALQKVSRTEATRQAREARRDSQTRSAAENRVALLDAAKAQIANVSDQMLAAISSAAPGVIRERSGGSGWLLRLSTGALHFAGPLTATAQRPVTGLPFDAVAWCHIAVAGPKDQQGYVGRAHSLWFCDAQQAGTYAWYETAFMENPRLPPLPSPYSTDRNQRNYLGDASSLGIYAPFALSPVQPEAAGALGPDPSEYQVAWPFMALRVADLSRFIDRWARWFAAASQEQLRRPARMPERNPRGSWRQEQPPVVDAEASSAEIETRRMNAAHQRERERYADTLNAYRAELARAPRSSHVKIVEIHLRRQKDQAAEDPRLLEAVRREFGQGEPLEVIALEHQRREHPGSAVPISHRLRRIRDANGNFARWNVSAGPTEPNGDQIVLIVEEKQEQGQDKWLPVDAKLARFSGVSSRKSCGRA